MVRGLNEAKIVLECGDKSMNFPGDGAVEEPDRHGTLLAGAFHLADGKLHLKQEDLDSGRG